MPEQNAVQSILDDIQKMLEARGVLSLVWYGDVTLSFVVQNGETTNRELNWKIKSKPKPKTPATGTK